MDFNFDTGAISSVLVLDPAGVSPGYIAALGTKGFVVPIGDTAARTGAATTAILRFNTDTSTLEMYNGATWVTFQNTNTTITNLTNLTDTGILVQTSPGVFAARSVVGTAGTITVANGSGVSGNVTVGLATAGTAGTYLSVTTDTFGRVTSGISTLNGDVSTTGNTVTLNTVNGNVGTFGSTTVIPVVTVNEKGLVTGVTTANVSATLGNVILVGDVTGTGPTNANVSTTLATVNSNVGTFGSTSTIPVVTVNAKGLVTGVTTANISGAITVTGSDLTMSGNTGTAITNATLATVNSNVGDFGSNNQVGTFVVNAKGLVTAAANVTITPASIGAVNVLTLGANSGVATLDGAGKLTTSQIPDALLGALIYQGVWNAATNTPTLASGVGITGHYYIVSVAGTTLIDGHATWAVGDMIAFNGATWDAIDGLPSEVTSVFGRVGAVTATLASADFANQGTTTTVLHGNANGAPSWGAVSLSTDVTGTLPATSFPALTGDITTLSGNVNTTLATVNSNVGDYGDATHVATFTVNSKGLTTAAGNVAIPLAVTITGDASGAGTTSSNTAITLNTVNANVGTFGSTTTVPVVTVNAKGLVTGVTTANISGAITVTGGDLTMSGSTGTAITNATLATVNSNVGTFGNATLIPSFTVNEKGLITAASNVVVSAASLGAVTNAGATPSIQSGTFAAMPAAGTVGRLYVTTDTGAIYRDTGSVWTQVAEANILYTENAVSPVASTVTGVNAVSIGTGNTTSGNVSMVTGSGASTAIYGAEVRANGSFSTAGDAQAGKYILRASTTNATQTEVFLDGATQRLVMPNSTGWTYKARIVAQGDAASAAHGGWEISGVIARAANAASTALVGSRSKTVLTRPSGSWDAEVFADTTNGALTFKVTGVGATNVRWVVTVETSEATY